MRQRILVSPVAAACLLSALTIACGDSGTTPAGPMVAACHFQGSAGVQTDIPLSDLATHRAHGDYVTQLLVAPGSASADSIHFGRLTDALLAVRAIRLSRGELTKANCRVIVDVASGTLASSVLASQDPAVERLPFVIDVPAVTVRGAFRMQVDGDGRATGVGSGGAATIIVPTPALLPPGGTTAAAEPIFIVNGHPGGSRGDSTVIEGFVFQSGRDSTATVPGGQGVFTMRVENLVVRGNRFDGGFTEEVDLRASSATVERNYMVGRAASCSICLGGPGAFIVRDNRLVGPGGIPGILSTPVHILPVPAIVEQLVLPSSSLVTGVVVNNDVRGHLFKPVGAGIRVAAVGVGAPDVAGTSRFTITQNTLTGNTFGIILEGGWPVAGTGRRGDIEALVSGNTITQSCQNDVLVTLSRHATGLGQPNPFPSYLRNSLYTLTLGTETPWSSVWVAHPAGFGNALTVNGEVMDNITRTAYDAARVCP